MFGTLLHTAAAQVQSPEWAEAVCVNSFISVTCRRSVVSSGYSGFLHQITDFIIIISPP